MFNPYADPTQTPFLEYNPNAIPEAYQEDMSKSPFQTAAPSEYDNQNVMSVSENEPSPLERFWDLLERLNGKGVTTSRKLVNGRYQYNAVLPFGELGTINVAKGKNHKRAPFRGDIVINYKPGDINPFTGTTRQNYGSIKISSSDPKQRQWVAKLVGSLHSYLNYLDQVYGTNYAQGLKPSLTLREADAQYIDFEKAASAVRKKGWFNRLPAPSKLK